MIRRQAKKVDKANQVKARRDPRRQKPSEWQKTRKLKQRPIQRMKRKRMMRRVRKSAATMILRKLRQKFQKVLTSGLQIHKKRD
eukprot:symbB.v1.2.005429.t1/scaffold312.1/size231221/5